ncbi:hypothetical protein [Streptococcus anginosus]|uniref:hypothetical protein n=1 Tax=Streptococcus anginosus TaxID=1328 RepID=UPI0022DFF3F3|nr:hypothetical protein [Streptococcus anginosus]
MNEENFDFSRLFTDETDEEQAASLYQALDSAYYPIISALSEEYILVDLNKRKINLEGRKFKKLENFHSDLLFLYYDLWLDLKKENKNYYYDYDYQLKYHSMMIVLLNLITEFGNRVPTYFTDYFFRNLEEIHEERRGSIFNSYLMALYSIFKFLEIIEDYRDLEKNEHLYGITERSIDYNYQAEYIKSVLQKKLQECYPQQSGNKLTFTLLSNGDITKKTLREICKYRKKNSVDKGCVAVGMKNGKIYLALSGFTEDKNEEAYRVLEKLFFKNQKRYSEITLSQKTKYYFSNKKGDYISYDEDSVNPCYFSDNFSDNKRMFSCYKRMFSCSEKKILSEHKNLDKIIVKYSPCPICRQMIEAVGLSDSKIGYLKKYHNEKEIKNDLPDYNILAKDLIK